MSTSTEYMDGLNAPAERRFYSRVTPPTPIYVAFGANNLGVLHNVSENGFQVTTPSGLPLNSVFRVFLSLNGAPKTIAVTVRTIWTDAADNRSGIQLLDLADEDRQQIRDWVELELSRSENSTPWFLPKNGGHKTVEGDPAVKASAPRQNFGASPTPPAPVTPPEPRYGVPGANAEQRNGRRFNGAFAPKDRIASAPLPDHLRDEVNSDAFAESESTTDAIPDPVSQAAAQAPSASTPPAPTSAEDRDSGQAATADESDLPKIANPFDHPDPNAEFSSPFPKVPLPIHGEFEYGAPPSKRRRSATLSSRMRAKPLLLWAAVLAVICFGASALVRYKIKLNSQRFASESAKYTAPKSATADTNELTGDSPAANGVDPSATKSQAVPASPESSSAPTTTAQNDSSLPAGPAPSHSTPKIPDSPRSAAARENGAYTATAPPASRRADNVASASQPAATPRSWTAPAPTHSASPSVSASDTPQSPSVTGPNDTVPAQSTAIVSQTPRPVPPPAQAAAPESTGSTSNSGPAATSTGAANNTQARTQQPATMQSSTSASNGNATSRPQAPFYNANTPQQRSAIIGSINSVHSSGIFDSNSTSSANAAPPAASRGGNANVATRPVSNASIAPSDTPQERDLEIVAPKGFTASWVDVPGEHVVRSPAGTIRMRRLIRVPGERIPGQRWLWRGKLNVNVGDVMNRIDPAALQASGASGSLTIQATIDKDGYVTDLKPLYGNFAMLPSVSRTVRNWHYEPTYLDSKRAETQAQIEFDLNPSAASNRSTRP